MSTTMVWWLLALSNPACVFLGFLFGRMTQATVEIEDRMAHDGNEETNAPSSQPRSRDRQHLMLQAVAVGVVLIGIITAIIGFNVTRNQDRLAGCVTGYSNSLADALDRRSASAAEATEKLDAVMEKVVTAFSSPPSEQTTQAVRDAILDYVEARRRAKEAQRENPLPDPPRDACAELMG